MVLLTLTAPELDPGSWSFSGATVHEPASGRCGLTGAPEYAASCALKGDGPTALVSNAAPGAPKSPLRGGRYRRASTQSAVRVMSGRRLPPMSL